MMHSNEVKNKIVELVSNLKDAETRHRGYFLTNDSVFLHKGAEERSNRIFATLDSIISDNPQQKENLKKLKKIINERYFILNTNLKLFKTTSPNLLKNAVLNGNKKMDEVSKQVVFMLQTEDTLLQKRIQVKDRTGSITPIFLLLLSLFSIFWIND